MLTYEGIHYPRIQLLLCLRGRMKKEELYSDVPEPVSVASIAESSHAICRRVETGCDPH